jgi:hypothetical protein
VVKLALAGIGERCPDAAGQQADGGKARQDGQPAASGRAVPAATIPNTARTLLVDFGMIG